MSGPASEAGLTEGQLNDPRVKDLYNLKPGNKLSVRINSTFFATNGWVPDADWYMGTFESKMWKSKKRGELRIFWEGDEKATSTTLKDLLQHALSVIVPTQNFGDDSSVPSSPSSDDSNFPIAGLGRNLPRAAASAANAAFAAASPGARSHSSWASNITHDAGGSPSGSSVWSPVAEQPNPSTPAPAAAPAPAPAPEPADPAPEEAAGDSSDEELEQLAAARKAFGTKYVKKTKDAKQPAKQLTWTLIDHTNITEDERHCVEGVQGTDFLPMLLNLKDKRPDEMYSMWKHFVPPEWLPKLAETANAQLYDDPIDKNYRKTTPAEIESILGLALGAALHGSGPFETYFSNSMFDESGLFPCPGFSRFGATKNRCLIVLRLIHLSDGPDQPAGKDAYWFIDEVIKQFNDHMGKALRPGYLGTEDETGVPWHGTEEEGNFNFCPHVQYVKRKPEPIQAEINDSADVLSRVVMKVEYEKKAKYHPARPLFDVVGSYNAAMTVSLAEPWKHSNAVIYGDSRFGSVKAAYYNMKLNGVHSLFDIKTGTALFPRKELVRLVAKEHASVSVMWATMDLPNGKKLNLYAIGQRRGPAVHTFLATCGTFANEVPARFPNVSLSDAPWTTVAVLNMITKAQPTIDIINRTLCDQVGLYDTFVTRCFETRFVQHMMLPLTYINAMNAARYFIPNKYKDSMPKKMLLELAGKMARNEQWLAELNRPSPPPGGGGAAASGTTRGGSAYGGRPVSGYSQVSINGGPPSRESPCKHVLIPLSQLEGYRGSKQQRCYECNQLCSWVCARCSTKHSWVALHPAVCQGSKRKYGCLAAHRRNPMGLGYKQFCQEVDGTSTTAKRRRKIDLVHVG